MTKTNREGIFCPNYMNGLCDNSYALKERTINSINEILYRECLCLLCFKVKGENIMNKPSCKFKICVTCFINLLVDMEQDLN